MSPQLAPEVLSMLRVVLADDSSAFRKITSLSAREILDAELRPSAPFLSKEERHLLRHHREEVGRLLYEGCMLTLQGPVEETKTILMGDVVEEDVWRRECEAVLTSEEPGWPAEREHLRIPSSRAGLDSRAAKLALGFLPTDDTRFALAVLCQKEKLFKESRTAAQSIIQDSRSLGHRASGLTVVATCDHLAKDHASALRNYREAALLDARVSTAFANWFTQAVLLGDVAEALVASEQLRAHEELLENHLDAHLAVLSRERSDLQGSDQSSISRQLRRAPIGSMERRILDALR